MLQVRLEKSLFPQLHCTSWVFVGKPVASGLFFSMISLARLYLLLVTQNYITGWIIRCWSEKLCQVTHGTRCGLSASSVCVNVFVNKWMKDTLLRDVSAYSAEIKSLIWMELTQTQRFHFDFPNGKITFSHQNEFSWGKIYDHCTSYQANVTASYQTAQPLIASRH